MKVAYLVNQYPHVSHSFVRREIHALERRGWAVHRFSIRKSFAEVVDPLDHAEAARTTTILAAGLPALVLAAASQPFAALGALREALRLGRRSDRGVLLHVVYWLEACWLARRLRADGLRHVHAHFGTNSTTVALLAAKLAGATFSFTAHGPEEFDKPEAIKLGDKVRAAAFAVAISSFGRSQLLRWTPAADWPKVHVVPCGLDADFLDVPPTPVPSVPRVVCVGRLCEQKGQLLLVEAVGRLRRDGVTVELVLAGDGPMRADVEAAAKRFGITDVVRITGWVSGATVREELLAARVMALPSFAEGLPVVIMEALALGRPVVSTYVAGIPELVRPGREGWLVPAGDVAALAEALREALASASADVQAMADAGRRRVRERHNIDGSAALLDGLFAQAVAGGDRPPATAR